MKKIILVMTIAALIFSCSKDKKEIVQDDFKYNVEKFADLEILRYRAEGFENLSLQEKKLIYYLSQAALEGRDILFDQNNRYNLAVRRTLESIYKNYKGDKHTENYKQFEVYLKRVWFSNGIHHHYGEEKFLPGFTQTFFVEAVKSMDSSLIPLKDDQAIDDFIAELTPVLFDPAVFSKKVNQAPDVDVIKSSSNNYYGEGVTQKEVADFYAQMKNPNDSTPVSFGLNSRLVKENGKLIEKIWKVNSLYSAAIEKIVYWLNMAASVAENDRQKEVIVHLMDYYKTGDLKKFDEYAISWVTDLDSRIDFVNGFTETYGDPLGIKASWESVVNFKDEEATKRSEVIGHNAQWFENHSPVDARFRKEKVKGVSAKVITAAMLGGDCYPATPIGINLPNANWIRKDYGSKSVTIANITKAYDQASQGNGFNEEFAWSDAECQHMKEYGSITDNLHTDLHECLGHGSGQLLPGVDPDALKIYGSTIEEARADLFGLYYIADPKMIELGLLSNQEAYKAEYYKYMMNGLMTQLVRIEPGKQIEESHMRNRALIAQWVLEKGSSGKVIELTKKNGKSYVVIHDYPALRVLIGQLLSEVQRVKSEGDFSGAKELVEKYAVKVDSLLHTEVLERYKKLNLVPYKGFVNPVYEPITDSNGSITDVKVSYTEGYTEQMMRYAKDHSHLPTYNN